MTLTGLGKFCLRERPALPACHPSTGGQIQKPADKIGTITVARAFRGTVTS